MKKGAVRGEVALHPSLIGTLVKHHRLFRFIVVMGAQSPVTGSKRPPVLPPVPPKISIFRPDQTATAEVRPSGAELAPILGVTGS